MGQSGRNGRTADVGSGQPGKGPVYGAGRKLRVRTRPALVPLLFLMLLAPTLSPAGSSAATVGELAQKLAQNADYRVRTQAAMALATTADEAAVAPLCTALKDAHPSVRAAAAAALGRLGRPAALASLEAAWATETTESVRTQEDKAIKALRPKGTGAPGPDAVYYVVIGAVTNKSTLPAADITNSVQAALRAALLTNPAFAVAPEGETAAQTKQVLSSAKLKGYALNIRVEPAIRDGDRLSQVLHATVVSLVDSRIVAEMREKPTLTGATQDDKVTVLGLVKIGAEGLAAKFVKTASGL